ncbi:MAG TPA: hypothetical protein VMW10_09855 [Alphaproteobacteria bacterium]|nr:hypothetical protein [Alphaproteobacteria bacterium]
MHKKFLRISGLLCFKLKAFFRTKPDNGVCGTALMSLASQRTQGRGSNRLEGQNQWMIGK